jgi:hypothetical protein
MRNFGYDPATDTNHPPCDILEIEYKGPKAFCSYGNHNYGHTYFYEAGQSWYWDTKGYVPNNQTSAHYQVHHYFTPLIYPFPLDMYLSEGAYQQIAAGQTAVETSGCGLKQCYDFEHCSPLNLSDGDAAAPFTGGPDGTVEFNAIVFRADKSIELIGSQGIRYDRDAVLRRTIVHEMGHALLAASENDHCSDPECIMFYAVGDWELKRFGPGNCTHQPGGSKDIRAKGVIHNSIH